MHGEWIRKPEGEASGVIVLVHGILSSGSTCWLNDNGCYWPELLKKEPELGSLGIYVFTYQTGFFSGTYRLSDIVDALKELMRLDGVLDSHRLIFVCHSMGGLVVRKFIVERAAELIEANKQIGLFLISSPSLGSSYADWLSPLARRLGHAQADALRFVRDNNWLADLDKEFFNLKEAGRLKIKGKELVEDKFVVLKKLWWLPQVVEPFSGAKYFGEPFKVPKSDHFSIAKPKDKSEIQHRLLCRFVKDMEEDFRQKSVTDRDRQMTAVLESVEQDSLKQLEHFTREITTALAHLESHVKLIAESPVILPLLTDVQSEAVKLRVHQLLMDHTDIGPYATTFILNRDGICVENSRHALSIGKDYSFRPYFKDAMQNRIGRFPAIGVTSGVLGHHIAYPVHHNGEIVGVACVEVDMEYIATQSNAFVNTETRGGDRPWIRALADENGVIMLSSEKSWIYRAVAPIPPETRQLVRQIKQYPGQDLAEIERFDSPETQRLSAAMPGLTVRGLRWKNLLGDMQTQIFAIREGQIAGGWSALIFWRLTIPS